MFSVGHGYDVHRLVEGRKLILGGVEIPYIKGLLGHSDADVLIHAIIDSIFGASCLGDIGKHFPDSDDRYKNICSIKLLKESCRIINDKKIKIQNIDSTIVAQSPKLSKYIDSMRINIAKTCDIPIDCVNVKATTEENLGFTGNHEGISAHAVCLVTRS